MGEKGEEDTRFVWIRLDNPLFGRRNRFADRDGGRNTRNNNFILVIGLQVDSSDRAIRRDRLCLDWIEKNRVFVVDNDPIYRSRVAPQLYELDVLRVLCRIIY